MAELDALIQQAMADGRTPNAAVQIRSGSEEWSGYWGQRTLLPEKEALKPDVIFDVASLTKVVATAPAIMILMEQGKLDLDAPVSRYLPELSGHGKDEITVRHLLTHTSGLRSGIPKEDLIPASYEEGMSWIYSCEPPHPPGEEMIYSDLNFLLLGELIQRVSGERLDAFVEREIWSLLGMWDTCYLPGEKLRSRIAPTEADEEGQMLHGVVHDPTSRRMGGVTGHAGVFSTLRDLTRFSDMMLGEGSLHGVRILQEESVREMTKVQSFNEAARVRSLGWDVDSWLASRPRGSVFPVGRSFGHTGYTGTSIWMDPQREAYVILLTSRLHPDGMGDVRALRYEVASLAAQVSSGVVAPAVKRFGPVQQGVDVLEKSGYAPLKGKRVGLITNHTGLTRDGRTTIDLLHAAPEVNLTVLFGPEHGIRGELDQPEIADGLDDTTGLPVRSLYGADSRKPSPESLEGLDALVFDIQDIGCRFYTYIATMGLTMEAAAEQGLEYFVLDRVNPIGGVKIDGPVVVDEKSFVTSHDIAIQHGMTVGELARMLREENGLNLELTVVPVHGWKRSQLWDQTGLTWVNPSPNMRNLEEAILYPGIGLLEFTNLSVGRGTETPFERIGAPWIDAEKLLGEMEALKLPGVKFSALQYTPTSSVHEGELCHGIGFQITNRKKIQSIDIGLHLAMTLDRLFPEYEITKFNRLLNHAPTFQAVQEGRSTGEIRALWESELKTFRERRARYLLY